jgi:hypothetical protein
MPAIEIAKALETIPKITELLTKLVARVKDRETLTIVQQIQNRHFKLHAALVEAQTKLAQRECGHAKAIEDLEAEIARLKAVTRPSYRPEQRHIKGLMEPCKN